MKVEIFFLKSNDLLSKLIKWLTQKPYSHCGFLFDSIHVWDTDFTRSFSLRYLPWNKIDFDTIEINLKQKQYEELMAWLVCHNKFPYDNINNIRWICGKRSNGESKLNCCESVTDALCDVGFLNPIYKSLNLSPGELYEILKVRAIT